MFLEEEIPVWLILLESLWIVVPILILAVVASIIAIKKRKKNFKLSKDIKIDYDAVQTNELSDLFGVDNIIDVSVDMSRVTVEVKDIDLVDTKGLQEYGASGILLVGNKVKCSFKDDADNIANILKGTIKND